VREGRVTIQEWPHPRTLADLEEATSAWVAWYNHERLMHRLGRRPPAEAEAGYWAPEHVA
jgi:putative transposase